MIKKRQNKTKKNDSKMTICEKRKKRLIDRLKEIEGQIGGQIGVGIP